MSFNNLLLGGAFLEGQAAFRKGLSITDNPYRGRSAVWSGRWEAGYATSSRAYLLGTYLPEEAVHEVDPTNRLVVGTPPEEHTIELVRPSIGDRHVRMFMAQAFAVAERSYARDLKVGALLVQPQDDGTHRIISDGYNGTEPGTSNRCEDAHGNQLPGVIHAERNLFRKLLRSNVSSYGGWLFVTRSPCKNCTELILDAGITAVFYCEGHRDNTPMARLQSRGVYLEQVDKREMVEYFDSISQRLRQPKFNEPD